MTVELFIEVLRSHLAALQSSVWPKPHGASTGPALYLDIADTRALITALTQSPHVEAQRAEREVIARRAYALYERRGRAHGCDLDDWLRAEREVRLAFTETAGTVSASAFRHNRPHPLWMTPSNAAGDSAPCSAGTTS